MVGSMKRLTRRHILVNFWIALAVIFINLAWVNGGESGAGELKEPSGSRRVTHYQQPAGDHPLTPEEMRAAKPMPMPSYSGPPIRERRTPRPFTGPPGASAPDPGGLARPLKPEDGAARAK
jgi:hypothetical protein